MTCIGRPSLSSGRGAELVEAERGDIDANPSQSPYGDSRPRAPSLALLAFHLVPQGEPSSLLWIIHIVPLRGAFKSPMDNSHCPPKGSLS